MFLEINGTQYELKFGFRFLRALDESKAIEDKTDGLSSLDEVVIRLGSGSVELVPTVAKAALAHHAQIPKDEDIETALENLAEKTSDGESLCSVFIGALKKAPLHTIQVEKMAGLAEKMLAMQNQMMEKSMAEMQAQMAEKTVKNLTVKDS